MEHQRHAAPSGAGLTSPRLREPSGAPRFLVPGADYAEWAGKRLPTKRIGKESGARHDGRRSWGHEFIEDIAWCGIAANSP